MSIRALKESDIDQLREIHQRYYLEEFTFPDFLTAFHCAFVVEDDVSGRIISGGGVRPIAESIMLTDKSYSPRIRKAALLELLQAQLFTTERFGYEGLHAFIQDDKWMSQLIRYGFRETVGKSLIIG